MRRRSYAWLAAGVLALSGCSAIPSNSPAQVVVNKIGGGAQAATPSITPAPDESPRAIVSGFLGAVASDDSHHTAARSFLTSDANSRWSDSTVTVVDTATYRISNFENGAVTLTARKIGSVTAAGTYTPDLQGDGNGDVPVPFVFDMKTVNGQWRIDKLPPTVILTSASFEAFYTQHPLFFYDLAEQHLVPDPRFSQLTDPTLLANWLIGQLVAGQPPQLQNAVVSEFPQQLDPHRVTVAVGGPSSIEIPGAGQLDAKTLNLLAAQIAATLTQVATVGDLTIVDAGRRITIPAVSGATFSAADFPAAVTPALASPSLYYISHAGVVDELGRPLPGAIGTGGYGLTSAAVAMTNGGSDLRVAGVTGSGNTARLMVGTLTSGLVRSTVTGRLSRPAWAPQHDEVWVGDGTSVLRSGLDGKAVSVPVSLSSGSVTGSVTALRFSPEGSRVALVFTAADGSAQVWVGAVVRNQAQVRVDGLEQITPKGVTIKDVAWNDPLKLFVIGRVASNGEANVFEVQVDGSLWTPRSIANLPQEPDSITVAENQVAWVSAGQTVWVQRAGSWANPGPGNGQTNGTNPAYLE